MTINKKYIVTGLIVAAIIFSKRFMNVKKTWSKRNDDEISRLHPKIREIAANFINDLHKQLNLKLLIVSGYRTFPQQAELYAQGRTKPGRIVTNAKPGYSYHNYGLAFDLAHTNVAGRVDWSKPITKQIADIGKKYGLEWGGSWRGFVDPPHFQLTLAPISKLWQLHTAKKFDTGGYVIV